jgi:hypothetical protein
VTRANTWWPGARHSLAHDETGDLPDQRPSSGSSFRAFKFIAQKLSPEDWSALQAVLAGDDAEDEQLLENGISGPRDPNEAKAMDAAARRFAKHHPNAARIGFDPLDPRQPTPAAADPKTARGFAERFPTAAKIGHA